MLRPSFLSLSSELFCARQLRSPPSPVAHADILRISLISLLYFRYALRCDTAMYTHKSGLAARTMLKGGPAAAAGGGKWIKGGFQAKMDRKEAAQILGMR